MKHIFLFFLMCICVTLHTNPPTKYNYKGKELTLHEWGQEMQKKRINELDNLFKIRPDLIELVRQFKNSTPPDDICYSEPIEISAPELPISRTSFILRKLFKLDKPSSEYIPLSETRSQRPTYGTTSSCNQKCTKIPSILLGIGS